MNRRRFIQAALAGGAVVAVPTPVAQWARAATRSAPTRSASAASSGFFLDSRRWATCSALCARVVPTGSDPATDPGATEAHAVVFIDRYLSAFELPESLADNPAIWVKGPFSGRNAEPNPDTGKPSAQHPADSMLGSNGQAHFLPLSRAQRLSWLATLYGPEILTREAGKSGEDTAAAKAVKAWAAQVNSGNVPAPPSGGQRRLYAAGLDAFDSWCESSFGTHYADASPEQQDVLLDVAGDPLVGGLSAAPFPSPPAPPAAACALFSTLLVHTYQACYGLPEYRWEHSNPLWGLIGYDGDTQPLGSTIYDAHLEGAGVGEGPNAGFGMKGVYEPSGGYVEYRPVSSLAPSAAASTMTRDQEAKWVPVILRTLKRGVVR